MKLYLAGPMRGYPDFNFPAFDAAAEKLRQAGHEVFNPADHDREVIAADGRTIADLGIRECMKADTAWICDNAEGVAVLTGWEESTGACAEVALARAIGIPVDFASMWVRGKARGVRA
jgi:nucleoside 2-deoxyribosyltransferase